MYIFNKVTVNPQLPKKISRLREIANNFWWSWNTEYLKLIKKMDVDLWERVGKNPEKFLSQIEQKKLEQVAQDDKFIEEYEKVLQNFDGYMNSKNTWFNKNYPNNKNDLIAYFSAEYGIDEILPIYSGGLGVLSGDHLKSASDLGIPLIAVGLLYKNGYFHQKINGYGKQETGYINIDVSNEPISTVKDKDGSDLKIFVKFPKGRVYVKIWQVNVGRVRLFLLDSDIEENTDEYKKLTMTLYGGNQETRIGQEILLGMAGVCLFRRLGINPTIYHMNEGHSAFLTLELIKCMMKDKQISFEMAKDIVSSKTIFTTHTPVPAGNDIFPIPLFEKYFKDYWDRLGITKEQFFALGKSSVAKTAQSRV
ncbi:MAG: alpha-glucan family phosphorylase [Clostridia bacterium]|nr:alpha-glucan family phosphorylase [Clostridia bacterium]